jgi:dipeptidase D
MQKHDFYLCDIQAGGLHNAIPREAHAVCAVPMDDKEAIRVALNMFAAEVEEEYRVTEPNLKCLLESTAELPSAVERTVTERLLQSLQAVFNGVFAICQDIDMVETSSNLASIKLVEHGRIVIVSSQRSNLASARRNMSDTVRAAFLLAGAKVETGEGYPGWAMNPNSELLKISVDTYKQLFHKDPIVRGIHAGLECGLFSEKYPNLDMVSFGPTLRGVHSPDERLLIPTVQMVWDHLLAILRNIPVKA